MKKILLLAMLGLTTLSSIASPWDLGKKPKVVDVSQWTQPCKPAFTDPFCVNFTIDVGNYGGSKKIHFYWELDRSAIYNYKSTIGVYGNWAGIGQWYKYFDIIIYQGAISTNKYFSMLEWETAQVESYDWTYEGPP